MSLGNWIMEGDGSATMDEGERIREEFCRYLNTYGVTIYNMPGESTWRSSLTHAPPFYNSPCLLKWADVQYLEWVKNRDYHSASIWEIN
jgi:hypothetical protein